MVNVRPIVSEDLMNVPIRTLTSLVFSRAICGMVKFCGVGSPKNKYSHA